MRTKAIAMSLVALLALAMLAVPGPALAAKGQGNAPPPAPGQVPPPAGANCRATIALQPTDFGLTLVASGNAVKRSDKNGLRQTFTVEVDALVPAGTVFAVFVNGTSLAGTITMAVPVGAVVAIGTLDLSNANATALPLGVDPVCGITSVVVTDTDGNIILSGSF